MMIVPKEFFVVTGRGASKVSGLNAFDIALADAGIDQCNLVKVSSILPANARRIAYEKIQAGSITFCVMAHELTDREGLISAGIGYAWCHAPEGEEFGIVAEDGGRCSQETVENNLRMKLDEMATARNMQVRDMNTSIASLEVAEKTHGSVVAVLVYVV